MKKILFLLSKHVSQPI